MNVVDSSAWLEYIAEGPNAGSFAGAIEDLTNLLVPVIVIYEVFKCVARAEGSCVAERCVADMRQGHVVELDAFLAMQAAAISQESGLPMADAIILATARVHRATLWTQDSDFAGMNGVEYVARCE